VNFGLMNEKKFGNVDQVINPDKLKGDLSDRPNN
jgi:hypothetical protein